MRKGEMLHNMLVLATNKHASQYDKGGMPYILHPLAVMHYLKTDDEELQCIALGHDLLEDTDTSLNELKLAGMTKRVIDTVYDLTKVYGESDDGYMARLLGNKDAMRVKLADLRHNSDIRRLKGVTAKDIKRMEKYHNMYLRLSEALK